MDFTVYFNILGWFNCAIENGMTIACDGILWRDLEKGYDILLYTVETIEYCILLQQKIPDVYFFSLSDYFFCVYLIYFEIKQQFLIFSIQFKSKHPSGVLCVTMCIVSILIYLSLIIIFAWISCLVAGLYCCFL